MSVSCDVTSRKPRGPSDHPWFIGGTRGSAILPRQNKWNPPPVTYVGSIITDEMTGTVTETDGTRS